MSSVAIVTADRFQCGLEYRASRVVDVDGQESEKADIVIHCAVAVGGFWKPKLVFHDRKTGVVVDVNTTKCGVGNGRNKADPTATKYCGKMAIDHDDLYVEEEPRYWCEQKYVVEGRIDPESMTAKPSNQLPESVNTSCSSPFWQLGRLRRLNTSQMCLMLLYVFMSVFDILCVVMPQT